MKKYHILTFVALLAGCSIIQRPDTNYVRVGVFQDRFDGMYYNYTELGKSVLFDKNNSVNASVGLQNGGTADLVGAEKTQLYWDVNYQLTF